MIVEGSHVRAPTAEMIEASGLGRLLDHLSLVLHHRLHALGPQPCFERGELGQLAGRVEIGEPSVVIAVASGHRPEAFDACRYAIDQLKRTVPLWKNEVIAEPDNTACY